MESELHRSVKLSSRLLSLALVLAGLYFCQAIIVPLALASLFAFLLSPLVGFLCRRKLPRAVAVVLVTMVVFSTLTIVMWLLGREAHHLASELPSHRQTIKTRIDSFKTVGQGGVIGRLKNLAEDLREGRPDNSRNRPFTLDPAAPSGGTIDPSPALSATPPETEAPKEEPPADQGGWTTRALDYLLSTMAEGFATAGLVILFTIFILLRQEDISQRFLKLIGYSRLTVTAKAMEEIGRRVSRYLLAQCALNGTYGLLLGIGLAVIGVPYVILWGVLAAFFRFIPYIGPWIVAILPIALSFAMFEGWTQPLAVIGLVLVLETLTNMILEPKVYGQSAGVSDFSLLLAIAFWTWIWGGIGLVLATPLTVCLVVFCKYIPSLSWVEILMGEKTEPQPHLHFYQKMLFDDEAGALTLIREAKEKTGLIRALDEIALPALALARREQILGRLEKIESESLYRTIHSSTLLLDGEDPLSLEEPTSEIRGEVFARAMGGEADSRALEMLELALPGEIDLIIASGEMLIGELMQRVGERSPALFCISALPPGAELNACILCRRIHDRFPKLPILVCRWGIPEDSADTSSLIEAGASWVTDSLQGAVEIITAHLPSNQPDQ